MRVDFIIETLMRERAGNSDALPARPAHQHRRWRWCATPKIAPRIREIVLMGGGLFRGRQHHAGRRVQHLCRPARGRPRAAIRHADHHGAARLARTRR